MTTLNDRPFSCPACGEPGVRSEVVSTNELHSRDLDMRPGEMLRSTMPFWVVRCGQCGYAFDPDEDADQLSDPDGVRAIVRTSDYRVLLGDVSLAGDFALRALLCERTGRPEAAGWASLSAAWACDDSGDEAGAVRHRLRAVGLWREALAAGRRIHRSPGAQYAVLADVLRRAGRFDAALAACDRGHACDDLDEGVRPALIYTRGLIERGDRGRHTLDDVRRVAIDSLKDLLGDVGRDLAAKGMAIEWEVDE